MAVIVLFETTDPGAPKITIAPSETSGSGREGKERREQELKPRMRDEKSEKRRTEDFVVLNLRIHACKRNPIRDTISSVP